MKTGNTLIPITLITGALGAGKTTLFNYLLNSGKLRDTAVMVNDFGEINIDALLIENYNDDTINLTNGCICCTISGDLLKRTLELTTRPNPPAHIIIESSGVSDPAPVLATLGAAELRRHTAIDAVFTVIDAERFEQLDEASAEIAIKQIEAASVILLNKTDLASDETLRSVKAFITDITPAARIIETEQCRIPAELFVPGALGSYEYREFSLSPSDASAGGHRFYTCIYESAQPLDWQALRRALQELPESVIRVKGILSIASSPERMQILHIVGRRAEVRPGKLWDGEEPRTRIALIGAGDEPPSGCFEQLFDNAIKNE